jgi:hypothetical protein
MASIDIRKEMPKYKCVQVTYKAYKILKVPIEWNVEDIGMVWDKIYYKDEEVEVDMVEDMEMKRPDSIDDMDDDVENWFDCEDSEDSEEDSDE